MKVEFIETKEKVDELLGKLTELAGTGMIEIQETFVAKPALVKVTPEAEIPHLESVLTVMNGQVGYAVGEYAALGPAPLAPSPSWSAVGHQAPYWRRP